MMKLAKTSVSQIQMLRSAAAQLEQLPEFLASKRWLFGRYKEAFVGVKDVRWMEESRGCESNYWLQTLILSENAAVQRDEILQAINDAGLIIRPAWRLTHQLAPYQECPRTPFLVAESLAQRLINLPGGAGLA